MYIYPIAWLVLRIVFAWMHLYPLIGLLKNWQLLVDNTAILFKRKSQFLSVVSVGVLIIGSISILLGIYARIGGVLLFLFNIGGSYIHYQYAKKMKAMAPEVNQECVDLGVLGHVTSAQKNIVLAAVGFFFMVQGSGPFSIVSF